MVQKVRTLLFGVRVSWHSCPGRLLEMRGRWGGTEGDNNLNEPGRGEPQLVRATISTGIHTLVFLCCGNLCPSTHLTFPFNPCHLQKGYGERRTYGENGKGSRQICEGRLQTGFDPNTRCPATPPPEIVHISENVHSNRLDGRQRRQTYRSQDREKLFEGKRLEKNDFIEL